MLSLVAVHVLVCQQSSPRCNRNCICGPQSRWFRSDKMFTPSVNFSLQLPCQAALAHTLAQQTPTCLLTAADPATAHNIVLGNLQVCKCLLVETPVQCLLPEVVGHKQCCHDTACPTDHFFKLCPPLLCCCYQVGQSVHLLLPSSCVTAAAWLCQQSVPRPHSHPPHQQHAPHQPHATAAQLAVSGCPFDTSPQLAWHQPQH